MAKKKVIRSGKTEFLRTLFTANPAASNKDATEAWQKAGHKDKIDSSLFYTTRIKMGAKKRHGRRKGTVAVPMANGIDPAKAKNDGYAAIEAGLDKLVVQAAELKDAALTEAIRAARRKASAKLV